MERILIAVALIVLCISFSVRTAYAQYATDITSEGMLSDTNSYRQKHGLNNLKISYALTVAAQAKANDMALRDYWSHNTPSGGTPWSFIRATGYSFTTAAENLEYGYTNSDEVITAWINSPEHRANLLNGSFTEVGFGIANASNYQGTGEETIVVAMYARPRIADVIEPVQSQPALPQAQMLSESIEQEPELQVLQPTVSDTLLQG